MMLVLIILSKEPNEEDNCFFPISHVQKLTHRNLSQLSKVEPRFPQAV